MNRFALILLALVGAAVTAPAQDNPLLNGRQVDEVFTRAVQLTESTMISVPGLARAAAPVLENARQAQTNLKAQGNRHPGYTYAFLTNLRAYLALADSMPRPYPFPEEASKQFAELRAGLERIDSHFRALLDSQQARLRNPDRDNLKRYADANAKAGPPQPNQPRVIFFGDSITDGWRLNEYFPDNDFINRGISGQITGEMLGRMKADVIDLQPKALVILAGTNDIARGVKLLVIKNNLEMIAELAKLHKIRVVMASLLPVHDYNEDRNPRYHRTTARPPRDILDLNDWMKNYCRKNRLVYLDYFAAMVDENGFLKKDLSDDGLHPNAAGYRVMSPLVWNAIMKVAPAPAGPRR